LHFSAVQHVASEMHEPPGSIPRMLGSQSRTHEPRRPTTMVERPCPVRLKVLARSTAQLFAEVDHTRGASRPQACDPSSPVGSRSVASPTRSSGSYTVPAGVRSTYAHTSSATPHNHCSCPIVRAMREEETSNHGVAGREASASCNDTCKNVYDRLRWAVCPRRPEEGGLLDGKCKRGHHRDETQLKAPA